MENYNYYYDLNGRQFQFEVFVFKYKKEMFVYELNDGVKSDVVGYAAFSDRKLGFYSSENTYVSPQYRNLGIAKQMYMIIHNMGTRIYPGYSRTKYGKLMWKAFRKEKLPFVKFTFKDRVRWVASWFVI